MSRSEPWLMGPQNLAFKRLQPADFAALLRRREVTTYIETGTFWGYQLHFAAQSFTRVYGIEIDPACVEISRKWNQGNPNVEVIQGDSAVTLPAMSAEHPEPCFFFLDAHWCKGPLFEDGEQMQVLQQGDMPLWRELEFLRDRNQRDIVFVDDIHAFGVEPGWESVSIPAVLEFMGERVERSEVRKDGLVIWMAA